MSSNGTLKPVIGNTPDSTFRLDIAILRRGGETYLVGLIFAASVLTYYLMCLKILVLLMGMLSLTEAISPRSEEHTSELQSLTNLVCRLLLEKKKKLIK